jgi:hypothetical protein
MGASKSTGKYQSRKRLVRLADHRINIIQMLRAFMRKYINENIVSNFGY